ncbi:M10 family metallopeptidase [Pseudomonas sp. NPDC086581]|uniref:M10 family metallopeptidase n=1 Tax=Pseudomonas sp. NPDC086581 TaxID=3364432 RepID=UPI00381E8FB2
MTKTHQVEFSNDDTSKNTLPSIRWESGIIYGGGNGITGSRSNVLRFDITHKSGATGTDSLIFGPNGLASKWGTELHQSVNLTYSFSSPNSVYNGTLMPDRYLTDRQIIAARQVMQAYANISQINFTEVEDRPTSAGDIRWARSTDPIIPTAFGSRPDSTSAGGDIWTGEKYDSFFTAPTPGTYGYSTFLHELGHSLGLGHPHQSITPVSYDEDQLRYSVMSYRDYAGDPALTYQTHFFPTSLMLNDVAAIQFLYGVNTSYQSGNNIYSWTANTSVFETIYDGGGIDTLDASNQTKGVLLNLNSGSWSQIGKEFWNGQAYVRDCLTIAHNTIIENATGSSHNDTLIGNSASNILDGGAGADTMTGGAGDDTYYVDNPDDIVIENRDEGLDTVISSVNYTLGANIENLTLIGSSAINGTGNSLNNTILGNDSENVLTGGAGNDILQGFGGRDLLFGGEGNDILAGDIGGDYLFGGTGNDKYLIFDASATIIEYQDEGIDSIQIGSDSITSYTLADNVENLLSPSLGSNISITGNNLSNYISLGRGNSTIIGGKGDDILEGGTGSDTYIFNKGDGADLIREASSSIAAAKTDIDVLKFGPDINSNQLWFSKQADRGVLSVGIIGTNNKISIESWYSSPQTNMSGCYIEEFQTSDGKILTYNKVDQLVNAMAAFSPPALGQTTLPSNYQQALSGVIAAAWS